jgi:flagellar motor switch protein FliG
VMNTSEITGIQKAAILIVTLDDDLSKEIIKDLDEVEIKLIGQEITKLNNVSEDIVKKVHDEFIRKLSENKTNIIDGENKFKKLIQKSFGDEKAKTLSESMEYKKDGVPGAYLRTCEPRLLAGMIRNEHPQTIAMVLSTLPPENVCGIMAYLPGDVHAEIIIRIADMKKVDSKTVLEIEDIIKEQSSHVGSSEESRVGGVEKVADILNQIDTDLGNSLLDNIQESDTELADRIRQLMFTFEDISKIDDRGFQLLLKELSSDEISLALKGASDIIKERIFTNMSERAAAMLKEDLEAMGPVKLSDVQQAQTKIAMIAKKLGDEGKIIISRGDEKFL